MKREHRPLARHKFVSSISFFLLLAAFILLLLVAISLPIVKAVYLISVKADVSGLPLTSAATELRFGVWGVCASSTLDAPGIFTNRGTCIGPQLGYDIPDSLLNLVGINTALADAVLHGLLVVLVLHPIAAALSCLCFLAALFLGSHCSAIFALIITIVSAILATVVLAIDLALVIATRDNVNDLIGGTSLVVEFGNGVWMVLGAVVCSWLAVIFLSARSCYCCGVRRHDHDHYDHHHHHSHHSY
ncbi:pH-response regulator palI/RIM9 [Pleurotus pulmonarius]